MNQPHSADAPTAVITGAASGIGRALAERAAVDGMRIAIADIDTVQLDKVADALRRSGVQVLARAVDVSSFAEMEKFAEEVRSSFGRIDVLFNNAGIETTGLLWDLPPARWEKMMAVNVSGVFNGIRAFVPAMVADPHPARVVNLSSIGGLGISPFQAPYIASKHAVLALTECLHQEFQIAAPHLSASAVLPGPVSTNIFTVAESESSGETHRAEMADQLREHGITPAAVAETVFESIAAGQLWIHTHPDLSDAILTARVNALLAREAPHITLEEETL